MCSDVSNHYTHPIDSFLRAIRLDYRFINCSGRIESRSLYSAREVQSPGTINGNGDEVILVSGSPSLAAIKGNPNARHFAIRGFDPNPNLMVNTTEVYDGTVRVSRGTYALEITAEGAWSIGLE